MFRFQLQHLLWTLFFFVCQTNTENSQQADRVWELRPSLTTASLRGLHVFDDRIIWASGAAGTILSSFDGGKSWSQQIVPGAKQLDFRDIHAIDSNQIVAMTSGTPARIYRSVDAGKTWRIVFESTDENVFLDAISFFDNQHGIAMSDPIDGRLLLLQTRDGGKNWQKLNDAPEVVAGEAGFAASGTNMIVSAGKVWIGLGGARENEVDQPSRLVYSDAMMSDWLQADIPIPRGPAAGVFSIAFADDQHGVVVGGDYSKPELTSNNFAVSGDGGTIWTIPHPRQPPSGYRSCVAVLRTDEKPVFVTVGPNGTDLSSDLGVSWQRISEEGFHAIQFSPDGRVGWAVGGEGRIAKWIRN
jgi:photosystem II stability/assembly factor-like uncharacterized protein